MSNIRRNTKKSYTQRDKRSFYLVASDVYFGIKFLKKETFSEKTKRGILTTPTFFYYDNQQKVIIDYSNSKNQDDLSYIFSFFSEMQNGITFAVTDANFVQDSINVNANLSGTYQFSSIENSKLIKANVVSVNNIQTKKDNYSFNFFTKTPQLSRGGVLSEKQQKSNIIKNTLTTGLYSFKRMGINVGDYIDFSGTLTNPKRKYKVIDSYIDNDGFETLQVDYSLEDEDLVGESVILNVYFEGETEDEVDLSKKTYGSCRFEGICFNAQSEFMCNKRAKILNVAINSYIPDDSCEDLAQRIFDDTSGIQDVFKNIQTNIQLPEGLTLPFVDGNIEGITFTSTGSLPVSESIISIPVTFTRPKINYKVIPIRIENGAIVDSKTKNTKVSINQNNILKLTLQDSSLIGNDFDFYLDKNSNKPLQANITKIGKVGTTGSYISLNKTENLKTIYLKSKQNKLLSFEIEIV